MKKICESGLAIVCLSEDSQTGELVALKELKRVAMDEHMVLNFRREVAILASVDHPRLLRLRGFMPLDSDSGDSPAIVSDYMELGSLEQQIEAERKGGNSPPGWDHTARFIVLYGISAGMIILHSKRIIHRDLKPENVLLDGTFETSIADFGFAKSVAEGESQNQSQFLGTTRFMAPEVYKGEAFDWSADIETYAMLAYITTTWLEIFPEVKVPHVFTKMIVKGGRPPFPPKFDGRWKNVIEDCWQSEPSCRPTFQEIVQRLGSPEFVNSSINIGRFRAYQSRILP
jgi:serine/threonine protein kinase